MMEQGDQNKDYQDYLKEGSNNVADDGNYSIQVHLIKYNKRF